MHQCVPVVYGMGDDIDSFILEQKKKLNQERNKLDNPRTNGYKENIPPKRAENEEGGGLLGALGSYEDKRRRLQEERKKEYNQLLAEKKYRSTGKVENTPNDLPTLPPAEDIAINKGRLRERHSAEGRRRAVLSDDEDDYYKNRPPPRKGWATPTYEEILDKKRREERAYRRYDDPDSYPDRGGRFDEGHLRPVKSEGHLNRYDDEDRFYRDSDRDYDHRRVRFQEDRKDFSRGYSRDPTWPSSQLERDRPRRRRDDDDLIETITQLKLKYGAELVDEVTQNVRSKWEPEYGRRRVSSPPRRQLSPPTVTSPPQNRRQTQSNTPRAMAPAAANQPFAASLLVGKETRVSADMRRKEEYRRELERQIEEARQNKKKAQDEDRRPVPGAGPGDVTPKRPQLSPRKRSPPPAPASIVREQPPVQPQPPPGISPMRDYGTGYAMNRPIGGILDNGWGTSLYGGPMVQPYSSPPGPYVSPGLGQPYMSPMDEAYYFYANRNPLDPNIAAGINGPGVGMMAGPRAPEPPPPRIQPEPRFASNPETTSPRTQAEQSTNRNTARGGAGFGGDVDVDRNKSRAEQQKQYQEELRRQMEEQKQKKKKMKEEEEMYNKKLDEEIKNYDPFGKGGGGAPMRDGMGNIVANRKVGQAQGTSAESSRRKIQDITSPTNTPRGLPPEPVAMASDPSLEDSFNKGPGDPNSGNHARGGNGIFGEPKTNQQKTQQQLYQEELRRQIEEKKKRQEEEKKMRDEEERKMMQKIQEDQDRIKQEMEEEKRKEREKAEAAQRQQEELRKHQEERKKEESRKRQEAEELRLEELRRKQDEERRQREQERATRMQSPVIPTMRNKDARKTDTPPVPALRNQIARQTDSPPVPSLRNQDNRTDSPVVPASRKQSNSMPPSRADSGKGSRVPSADVLKQLARMRQQLRSEKERVETDLTREKGKPTVYDPRTAPTTNKNDLDVFEIARNREPVSVRRGRDTSRTSTDNLEFKQRLQLKKQEEELSQMKKKSPFEQALPGMDPKDLGIYRAPSAISANMLESESAFIAIPNYIYDSIYASVSLNLRTSRSPSPISNGTYTVASPQSNATYTLHPDDDDVPNGAASRSETPRRKSIPRSRAGVDPMKVGSMVSVASLDPDAINARNEARLNRLKQLAGDNVSTGDPDEILERFMASHKRPPSGLTLQDDTWLQAG